MASGNLRQVVGPLECIATLRNFAFKIIADSETTGNRDKRNTFAAGSEVEVIFEEDPTQIVVISVWRK